MSLRSNLSFCINSLKELSKMSRVPETKIWIHLDSSKSIESILLSVRFSLRSQERTQLLQRHSLIAWHTASQIYQSYPITSPDLWRVPFLNLAKRPQREKKIFLKIKYWLLSLPTECLLDPFNPTRSTRLLNLLRNLIASISIVFNVSLVNRTEVELLKAVHLIAFWSEVFAFFRRFSKRMLRHLLSTPIR